MCDLVYHSTETAYAVLHNLRSKAHNRHDYQLYTQTKNVANETDHHSIFDDELHEVFFYGGEEILAGIVHQRHHEFQDLGDVANHDEVILILQQYGNSTAVILASRGRCVNNKSAVVGPHVALGGQVRLYGNGVFHHQLRPDLAEQVQRGDTRHQATGVDAFVLAV